MNQREFDHIAAAAEVDELLDEVQSWIDRELPWRPYRRCRALLRHVLRRLQELRGRFDTPLVLGTFGGTGTGKSTLVNALVGRECVPTGRVRPTTRRPLLVAHPDHDLEGMPLPLECLDVVRCDAPFLRDVLLIDCPDPDTSESAGDGGGAGETNLSRLRRILPACDVLLYCTTQQKYRSSRVLEELRRAAPGCRLFFVQTHAATDDDIRDDWARCLGEAFDVPQIFFVDSLEALRRRRCGEEPNGDFARLVAQLAGELAATERLRIRRANLLDLLLTALRSCRAEFEATMPAVRRLQQVLEEQERHIVSIMAGDLLSELRRARGLWERRLLGAAIDQWGSSPFSAVLRLYHGLGGLLTSASLFRARTPAQMALVGTVHGARWLRQRKSEWDAEQGMAAWTPARLADGELRRMRLICEGYVRDAQFDAPLVDEQTLPVVMENAERLGGRLVEDVGRHVDEITSDLAARHTRWFIRWPLEALWLALAGFLLYRIAKNFFYDSFWYDRPLLSVDFYLAAGVILLLWSGFLALGYTRRLRRRLDARLGDLSAHLAETLVPERVFGTIGDAVRAVLRRRDMLESLVSRTDELRSKVTVSPVLGAGRIESMVVDEPGGGAESSHQSEPSDAVNRPDRADGQ